MIFRLGENESNRVNHMFRFDIAANSTTYVEWGVHMINCDESCYLISKSGKLTFYVPDVNFFLMMKLSCDVSNDIEVKGHNSECH